jgi:hypothetical protein
MELKVLSALPDGELYEDVSSSSMGVGGSGRSDETNLQRYDGLDVRVLKVVR